MEDVEAKPSRALPLAVMGGIAVAVFGILLVMSGSKGKSAPIATNDPPTSQPPSDKPVATPPTDKATDKPTDKPADTPADKPADKPVATNPPTDTPKTPDTPKTATLTINVKPADAKVTVDGKPVTGGKIELPVSDTPVKVAASATGYEPDEKQASVAKDGTVTFDLKKQVAAVPDTTKPTTKPTSTPTKPTKPKHPKVEL